MCCTIFVVVRFVDSIQSVQRAGIVGCYLLSLEVLERDSWILPSNGGKVSLLRVDSSEGIGHAKQWTPDDDGVRKERLRENRCFPSHETIRPNNFKYRANVEVITGHVDVGRIGTMAVFGSSTMGLLCRKATCMAFRTRHGDKPQVYARSISATSFCFLVETV